MNAADIAPPEIDEKKKKARAIPAYQKLLRGKLGSIFTDCSQDDMPEEFRTAVMDMESVSSLQAVSLQCRIRNTIYIVHVCVFILWKCFLHIN